MPEPAEVPYPQYPALVDRARAAASGFVSPTDLEAYQEVIGRRGSDWCTAVLARAFPGLGRISVREAHLLLLADADDLNPPLPPAVVAARAARAAHEAEVAERRRRLDEVDQQRWDTARAGCAVELEVRANSSGRRYRTGLPSGPLRHAVPLSDAASGSPTRPRRHPAGRAVCETVTRAKPRQLAEPADDPVTCTSCLTLVPKLRPAE